MSSLPEMPGPPTPTPDELERLVQIVKDWTMAHGLAVRPPPAVVSPTSDPSGILATSAPVTLFPSPFPRSCFAAAKSVQRAYNELYANISQDEGFLERIVKEVVSGDEFIENLWDVHLKVKSEGYVQGLSLGLFRSDYLVHQDPENPEERHVKQVEFNTIASSFGGLSTQTTLLHRFLSATEYPSLKESRDGVASDLPENTSTRGLAMGMRAAFDAYSDSELGHDRCIIFLVQGGERNVFDQRHLEYEVNKTAPALPVFRLPFAEILQRTSIADTRKRQLLYRPPSNPCKVYEVSVVYLRAGYGPADYASSSDWDARYQIERSAAIKCPTVLCQLAGTKKVQQVLATPAAAGAASELDRFVTKPETARQLRRTFAAIYPMDESSAGLEARRLASSPAECVKYVLKPQREGGGNNHYRAKIPQHLRTVPREHWSSFILMELITPPPVRNLILRHGKVDEGGVICELGIFGACVWDHETGEMMHNEEAGYLLRTKGDQSEEGGVAAGFGCMDSCNLV